MARAMKRIPLLARGQVYTELLPAGSIVVRTGYWQGFPCAWVWMDMDAPRNWLVEFLMVADGDRVENDAFWPVGTMQWEQTATIWTVLTNWRKEVKE